MRRFFTNTIRAALLTVSGQHVRRNNIQKEKITVNTRMGVLISGRISTYMRNVMALISLGGPKID